MRRTNAPGERHRGERHRGERLHIEVLAGLRTKQGLQSEAAGLGRSGAGQRSVAVKVTPATPVLIRRCRARAGGPKSPARQIVLAVLCCLGGCASRSIYFDSLRPLQPYDSSRNSITAIPSGITGGVSLPHRDLIRVDFTSGTDLRNLVAREDNILFVHSYFCDRGDELGTLGDPGVYVDRADAGKETLVKRFLFFVDVSRKSNPGSIPPEPGFDLSVNAQDICFYIAAHGVTTAYKSKVETIPKASIEQVFIGWKLH
jgi:hypothetical protein